MTDTTIQISSKFAPIGQTDKRYIVVTGGRGSSKSFSVGTMILDLTHSKNKHRILFSRFTMTAANISIIPEFVEKINLLGEDAFFQINKREIKNVVTGNEILFRGIKTSSGNQTANLKSIQGVTTWVLEEAEELTDENIFDTIDLSIRAKDSTNRVILILNPVTKEHWIYKRWFEGYTNYVEVEGEQIAMSSHPDILHIHTTYLDNIEHLSETFLKRIQQIKEKNYDKYVHRILGGWLEKAEGVIFDNWKEGVFDDSFPTKCGLDFGYSIDPTALIEIAVDEKRKIIYARELLYEKELSTDETIQRLESRVSKNKLIVADSADPRFIRDIRDANYNVKPSRKGADSVRHGIKHLMNYQIIVDPDSHNLKAELNNYVWNDKRSATPIDRYNHLIDAMRYAIFYNTSSRFIDYTTYNNTRNQNRFL